MSLRDLGGQFVSRLDKFVAVRSASTGEVSVKKGALAPIEISSGKKGPKVVTRVQGMEVSERVHPCHVVFVELSLLDLPPSASPPPLPLPSLVSTGAGHPT